MTIRLKFDILEGSHIQQDSGRSRQDSFNTISFKRKNAKQVSRDKARARKRKRRSTSSIETVRGHDFTVLPSEQKTEFTGNDVSIQCTPKSFEIPEIVREHSDGSESALCTVEAQIAPALNLNLDYSLENGGVNDLDDSDKVSNESPGACGEDYIQNSFFKDALKELRQESRNQRIFSLKDVFEELRQEFRNQHQDFTLDVTEQDTKT